MIPIHKIVTALGTDVTVALSDDAREGVANEALLSELLSNAEETVREEIARAGYEREADLSIYLENLAVTLAVEELFHRRREAVPGVWSDRANRARTLLSEIGDGRRLLPNVRRVVARVESVEQPCESLHRPQSLHHL